VRIHRAHSSIELACVAGRETAWHRSVCIFRHASGGITARPRGCVRVVFLSATPVNSKTLRWSSFDRGTPAAWPLRGSPVSLDTQAYSKIEPLISKGDQRSRLASTNEALTINNDRSILYAISVPMFIVRRSRNRMGNSSDTRKVMIAECEACVIVFK
jgi:hypothetical protein